MVPMMPAPERQRKFRYDWTRTDPGSVDDFCCWESEHNIGRVRLHASSGSPLWVWAMGDDRPGRIWAANGSCDSRDAACHALEAAFDQAVADHGNARRP